MSTRAWSDVVHLRSTSAGVDPTSLEPGRDVVLDAPRAQALSLPFGVLLDDLLPTAVREDLDRRALEELKAWRAWRDRELTIDGVCLPHIWEVELLAEVFLPETRIFAGLQAALGGREARRVICEGIDDERVGALRSALAPADIEVSTAGPPVQPPSGPSVLASPWRWSLRTRALNWTIDTVGVPMHVRGDVYLRPYWHLTPVFRRAAPDGLRFVVDPRVPPIVGIRALARAAARGGWIGAAGYLARRRARRSIDRALSRNAVAQKSNALGELFDSRALEMIKHRAAVSLAEVCTLRRAFATGKVKLAILPFDSPADARLVIQVAREAEVGSLVVQHGFVNGTDDPDMTLADAVAVWAEVDAARLRRRTRASIAVTGNPGAADVGSVGHRARSRTGRTLVLVEYASRLSTRIDSRVSVRHVDTALQVLAKERPGTEVVIRPHPAEHEPDIFEGFADLYPKIRVIVDSKSSITDLIKAADLCIGAVSTATLQAGASGVPVLFLNITDRPAPWPLDGSTDVPVASTAEELGALVPVVLSSEDVRGRAVMLEALGAKSDAVDRVVELIRMLTKEGQPWSRDD
jgi:hypothetical protein